jgi:hypothetical protein
MYRYKTQPSVPQFLLTPPEHGLAAYDFLSGLGSCSRILLLYGGL